MKKHENLKAVVFCKDCKYLKKHRYTVNGEHYYFCDQNEFCIEEHDFCSRGERKEDE